MTRIFTNGAEMGDTLFWSTPSDVTVQNSSPSPFRGDYYYRLNNNANVYVNIPELSELYFRFRYHQTGTISNPTSVSFRNSTTQHITLTYTYQLERFTLNAGGTSGVAYSTNSFPMATWYLIEVYVKIADSPNGRCIVKVDGNIEIDYTGDTKNGATTVVNNIFFLKNSLSTTNYDDLALNDTDNSDGKNNNSWCGDGAIVKLTPSGSGTHNYWFNSGSVSGSANYLYVDEYPYDSDTTYVYASGSLIGFQDQYRLSAFDGSNRTIRRIYAESRVRKSASAVDTSVKVGFLPSGGTDTMSGSIALTTSYTRVTGSEVILNPYTSASWTTSDLNALEYIIEIGSQTS